jgi:hypothetical protein
VDRFEWDPPFDPGALIIPSDVVAAVPAELARGENVMPLALRGGVLTVAVDRPADFELIDKLRFVLGACGLRVEAVAAPAGAIRAAVERYYGGAAA